LLEGMLVWFEKGVLVAGIWLLEPVSNTPIKLSIKFTPPAALPLLLFCCYWLLE
jgi:hypothetical protein